MRVRAHVLVPLKTERARRRQRAPLRGRLLQRVGRTFKVSAYVGLKADAAVVGAAVGATMSLVRGKDITQGARNGASSLMRVVDQAPLFAEVAAARERIIAARASASATQPRTVNARPHRPSVLRHAIGEIRNVAVVTAGAYVGAINSVMHGENPLNGARRGAAARSVAEAPAPLSFQEIAQEIAQEDFHEQVRVNVEHHYNLEADRLPQTIAGFRAAAELAKNEIPEEYEQLSEEFFVRLPQLAIVTMVPELLASSVPIAWRVCPWRCTVRKHV